MVRDEPLIRTGFLLTSLNALALLRFPQNFWRDVVQDTNRIHFSPAARFPTNYGSETRLHCFFPVASCSSLISLSLSFTSLLISILPSPSTHCWLQNYLSKPGCFFHATQSLENGCCVILKRCCE